MGQKPGALVLLFFSFFYFFFFKPMNLLGRFFVWGQCSELWAHANILEMRTKKCLLTLFFRVEFSFFLSFFGKRCFSGLRSITGLPSSGRWNALSMLRAEGCRLETQKLETVVSSEGMDVPEDWMNHPDMSDSKEKIWIKIITDM